MRIKFESRILSVALIMGLAAVAYGQSPDVESGNLASEVTELKTENIALREQLNKVEEQQKMLLEVVNDLKQRLTSPATPIAGVPSTSSQPNAAATGAPATSLSNIPASRTGTPQSESVTVARAVPPDSFPFTGAAQPESFLFARAAQPESFSFARAPQPESVVLPAAQPQSGSARQAIENRYRDGIIVAEAPEGAEVPFMLRFQGTTQVRYLNSLDSQNTFTDHLGNTYAVDKRNDITVNRSMMVFGGYVFSKKAPYSFTVWTSAGAASIVIAGNIGWQFNKRFMLTGGYTGVPGSRSLVGTFPFFNANDRTMADNFFRPGFTQGVWASGEAVKGLNYIAFLGNGLNTLSIAANKIDTNLLVSGSVWWEPLGDYGPPGRSRNMYDDYYSSGKVRIRVGTSFTRSRENRFSDLDTSSPENTSIYNSDGVKAFQTGAFAPGVTLQDATYKMSAIDYGLKWNGLAVNGQYFMRWLNDFVADGPLPLSSTFDHGNELSLSYFVKPKKLMPYVRASWVRGQFRDPYEYAAGLRWYYLPTERLWLNAEVMHITGGAPYSGTFTPYTSGMTNWVPMIQGYIAF